MPKTLLDRLTPSAIARFRKYFVPGAPSDCWEWSGYRAVQTGYGAFNLAGTVEGAHRVSFALHTGEEPGASMVCHTCDNRPCVNPGHLFRGTGSDNARDMVRKGRQVLAQGSRGKAKVTENDVMAILADSSLTNAEWGERLGISANTVANIRAGRRWRHMHDGRPRRGIKPKDDGSSSHLSISVQHADAVAMRDMRMVTGMSDTELFRKAIALLVPLVLGSEAAQMERAESLPSPSETA